jgi:hypothetical protein
MRFHWPTLALSASLLAYGCSSETPTAKQTAPPASLTQASTAVINKDSVKKLFTWGVAEELVNAGFTPTLEQLVDSLSEGQMANLQSLLTQAKSDSQRVLVLKCIVAGEPWENVAQYAKEIRDLDDATVIAKSLMRQPDNLIQQWQDACGPAIIEVAVSEQDPRFAWELNKGFPVHNVDPLGANKPLADQQKEWLEKYGGVAVERGSNGGKGVGILELLNGTLGPIVKASYTCYPVDGAEDGVNKIVAALKRGYTVPIRVEWVQGNIGHFMLALSYREGDDPELLIYDPYYGKTAWRKKSEILISGVSPSSVGEARLSHYYEPTPTQVVPTAIAAGPTEDTGAGDEFQEDDSEPDEGE